LKQAAVAQLREPTCLPREIDLSVGAYPFKQSLAKVSDVTTRLAFTSPPHRRRWTERPPTRCNSNWRQQEAEKTDDTDKGRAAARLVFTWLSLRQLSWRRIGPAL